MQVRTATKMEADEEEQQQQQERKKGRGRARGETGERQRTSKNISENTAVRMSYRLADSTAAVATPVGRWCERGRAGRPGDEAVTEGGTLLGGYGGGKDDGRSALRKRITLCGPTKTNRARGSDPLHPLHEPPPPPPPPLTSSPVA